MTDGRPRSVMSRSSTVSEDSSPFAAKEPPRGVQFAGQSGSIGGVSYRNLLNVNVAKDGLFLTVPVLFTIGHKPLFIPLSAIKDRKTVKFLWHEAISFQVGPRIKISLPSAIFEDRNAQPAA